MSADFLHVGDQFARIVLAQFPVGGRAAATALVEGDDAIEFGIVETARIAVAGAARAAVDEQDGNAVGIARFVQIEFVQV